jgi:hypothetical protein
VEATAAFFKEWNQTLIEDSMACAYSMLLTHIPHNALYSLWPCSPLVATPWNLVVTPVFRILANNTVLEVVDSAERVAALDPKTVFVGDSIACNRHAVPILCKHYRVVICTKESNQVRDCFKAAGVEIHVVEFDELLRLFLRDLTPFENSVIFDMLSPLLEQIVLNPESREWRELLMSTAFVPPSSGRGSKLCKPSDLFEECSEFKAILRKFDFPGGGFKQLKAEDPKLIALKHLGLKSQLTWYDLEQVLQSISDEVDGQQHEHAKAVLAFLNTVPNPRFQQDSPCNTDFFRAARWLPAKRPSTSSLPWKTPETVLQPCSQLCLHADRYLLGFTFGILDSKLNQVLRDLLGFTQHYVQADKVVTNLIHFLEWRTERAESSADFTNPDEAEDVIMQSTYDFLALSFFRQEALPEAVAAFTRLRSKPWIVCMPGANAMFVAPSQIVLPTTPAKGNSGVSHLAPHFYPLPHQHRQLHNILESLGVQELNTMHFEQTLDFIGNTAPLSDEQVAQCVAILGIIVADPSFSSHDALPVPTTTGVLRRVSEVSFDNAPFVDNQMKTSLHIAHGQLSLDLAKKSGLKMVTLELMKVCFFTTVVLLLSFLF